MNLLNAIIYFQTDANQGNKSPIITGIQQDDLAGTRFKVQFDDGEWVSKELPNKDSIRKIINEMQPGSLEDLREYKQSCATRYAEQADDIKGVRYHSDFFNQPLANMTINNRFVDNLAVQTREMFADLLTFQSDKDQLFVELINERQQNS